jgi:hypothetical protein
MALQLQPNRDKYGRDFDSKGEKNFISSVFYFSASNAAEKIKTNRGKSCTRLELDCIERSYRTIFQVSFIINSGKQTRKREFFSLFIVALHPKILRPVFYFLTSGGVTPRCEKFAFQP